MTREIKFRAWDETTNLMVYPSDYKFHTEDYSSGIILQRFSCVMQYTGLKDANGKEIYEGDIIKWGHLPDSKESEVRIATVRIDPDIQFDCKNISYPKVFHYGNFAYGGAQLEVIGNIYETPELIKGSKRVNT